ncbi:MAG: peptidoglycan DD-metalloendopeptidase family protein [Xanthomonadales bacterium]|nr:peptidoglycan DD-metalloendopeptidase family protein [Xanthomonadales bacterium]
MRTDLTSYRSLGWAMAAMMALVPADPAAFAATEVPDREQAEQELRSLLHEINRVQDELESARKDYRGEQSRLRELDLAIQQANLDYRALENERQSYLVELERLENHRSEYVSSLDRRLERLSSQVSTSYRLAKQSRLKLLLNQDDPARLGRLLAYYDYINRAQVEKVSELKDALTTLDAMQESIDRELIRIEGVQTQQQHLIERLNEQRGERSKVLAALSEAIGSDEDKLQELQRNRRDLEVLIERLADALADIPPELGNHVGVERQKGKLPLPVTGRVMHAFGQPRAGGMNWQGWLISAEPGTDVKAVAYGRVAFADWLRGYGLMIIIDHGAGFLSLYGHNETLLQDAGDWVAPGQPIGIIGANPGSGQGLYFELRKEGKALDPAAWIAR